METSTEPRFLSKEQQLGFVLSHLHLTAREPRCMACSGNIVEVPKDQVRPSDFAPPN